MILPQEPKEGLYICVDNNGDIFMTNFLKMAQEIADSGYDVYLFKRFADGGRGDFVPQISKIRTIFFVNRQTGRIYTCLYNCFRTDRPCFEFGAIEYSLKTEQLRYGWDGYGYWCKEDGSLETAKVKDFLEDITSDMEKVYSEDDGTDSILYKAEALTERDIAELGYALGFRYKNQIRPTRRLLLSGSGYGYKISAEEYYAEMKKQNPNVKIVVVDPQAEWEQIIKMGDSSFFFLK